ncbi:hypothetical protein MLD38_031599 [Melastoma candidum]|uniref:Uncharacterized protein n=1 Tax=Melastoma candidum TaxID=119954 RepID=A0ACB9MUW5_9MYRT|nr:hypothetical protein MLD38_031599 [Melastoma candidum]
MILGWFWFLVGGCGRLVYQLLFFVVTALLKFDKVTDFAVSTNFIIIAVLTLVLKGTWYFRQVVLTVLVVVWGLRLNLFLLMRILQWGEDRRFDEMRNNLGKLAVFWIIQAVWVWTVSLPVTVIILWWGIFISASPVLSGADWLVVFEPVFLTLLLLYVSGIPLLEASAYKKFANVADYRAFKRTTSPLIPLPITIYGSLPPWMKSIFLFEFPIYSRNFPKEGSNWNRRTGSKVPQD